MIIMMHHDTKSNFILFMTIWINGLIFSGQWTGNLPGKILWFPGQIFPQKIFKTNPSPRNSVGHRCSLSMLRVGVGRIRGQERQLNLEEQLQVGMEWQHQPGESQFASRFVTYPRSEKYRIITCIVGVITSIYIYYMYIIYILYYIRI